MYSCVLFLLRFLAVVNILDEEVDDDVGIDQICYSGEVLKTENALFVGLGILSKWQIRTWIYWFLEKQVSGK